MKLLRGILFVLLMGAAVSAHALSQEVQVDLLMNKITASLKADKPAEALPYFGELERMEPSLSKPLPESFYFYYIETLDKTGARAKALTSADSYLEKYGKKGKHYDKVIEIMSRLQIQADKEAKEKAVEYEAAMKKNEAEIKKKEADYKSATTRYQEQLTDYEEAVANCPNKFRNVVNLLEKESLDALRKCERRGYCNPEYDSDFVSKRKKFLFTQRDGYEAWCEGRYTRPTKPSY